MFACPAAPLPRCWCDEPHHGAVPVSLALHEPPPPPGARWRCRWCGEFVDPAACACTGAAAPHAS